MVRDVPVPVITAPWPIRVSILLSFALLPILLSITEPPNATNPKSFSLKELFIISPLGFVGAFFTGLAHSAILGYGAVFAAAKDLGLFEISIFMLIVSSFGAIFQWPVGYISDKIDRRIVLIGVTFIAAGLSLFIVVSSYISLLIFFLLFHWNTCKFKFALALIQKKDFRLCYQVL